MTADVVNLQAVVSRDPPDELVIAEIEKLLDKARSGQLRCFAWAAVYPEWETGCDWTLGSYSAEMMAAISDLQFRYALMRYEARVAEGLPDTPPAA